MRTAEEILTWLVRRAEAALYPEQKRGVELVGRPGEVVLVLPTGPISPGEPAPQRIYIQLQDGGQPDVVKAFDRAITDAEVEDEHRTGANRQ